MNKIKIILIACIWLLVTIVMVIINERVFVNGETIKLELLPMSNLITSQETHIPLNFKISKIAVDNPFVVARGQKVYSILKKDKNDVYAFERLETKMPKRFKPNEIGIVGTVTYTYSNHEAKGGFVTIDYGIGTFFTPKDELATVKKNLASGGVAQVKVSKNGIAKVIGFEK